jgi:hypothetical protein
MLGIKEMCTKTWPGKNLTGKNHFEDHHHHHLYYFPYIHITVTTVDVEIVKYNINNKFAKNNSCQIIE